MTSSVAVFEAAIRVKSKPADKIMFENQEKNEKIWKLMTFLHGDLCKNVIHNPLCKNSVPNPSNRWIRNGIHSLLSRADARVSADMSDIIYRICDAFRYFVGQA